jgi:hypothetical protein
MTMNVDWMIADFEAVLPSAKVSRDSRIGRWQIVDYATCDQRGKLILANPGAKAPEVAIRLPLKGRYDLVFGFFVNFGDRLLVKLAHDRCYDRLEPSPPFDANPCFQDVLWRTVKLSGAETLLLKQDDEFRACLGYVLACPSSRPAAPVRGGLALHVTDDGFPAHAGPDHEDASWLADHFDRLGADLVSRGVDLNGMANYATRHASLRIACAKKLRETFPKPIYRQAFEVLQSWIRDRYRVPRRYYEVCRQRGMKAFGYGRMAHLHAPPPYQAFGSRLYDAHPEFRCLDQDGTPINRLSVAFPAVRAEFLKLFTEQIELGADGIHNVFVRGVPLAACEAPVRERFFQMHGGGAAFAEEDPRVWAARASCVTDYMREQRQALDAAARPGRRPVIIATVPATRAVCAFYGLDVADWVRGGLVDVLCPYGFGLDAGEAALEMEFFCRAVEGSGVRLMPFVNTWRDWRRLPTLLDHALELHRWPIHGLSVWDAGHAIQHSAWLAVTSLRSPETIRAARDAIVAGAHHRLLRTYDGVVIDRYSFGWNF